MRYGVVDVVHMEPGPLCQKYKSYVSKVSNKLSKTEGGSRKRL